MTIFVACCPPHLHRVLLLFGLQLLENMLGFGGRGEGGRSFLQPAVGS